MRGSECNRGKSAPERLYWRKESKGEDGIERTSVSWELFFISQAESCAFESGKTHSAAFLSAHRSFPFTPSSIHSARPLLSVTLIYFLICFASFALVPSDWTLTDSPPLSTVKPNMQTAHSVEPILRFSSDSQSNLLISMFSLSVAMHPFFLRVLIPKLGLSIY